jgi:Lantibiotic biosynthesis dehydratase C-term
LFEVQASETSFPDPLLTANIYCDNRLDELVHRVVAPFWQEIKAQDPQGSSYLWIMRYTRRGEHLKLRLHGPAAMRPLMQRLLGEALERYFGSVESPREGVARRVATKSPPIDIQDQVEGIHPDRAFLWTDYRRSHVSLAGEPFLLDDRYTALFTRCLSRGCERVLQTLRPDSSGEIPRNVRQTTLVRMLIDGLAGLRFTAEQRASYLAYHRNWLVRFTLLRRQADPEKAVEALAQFDRRLEKMESQMNALRSILDDQREGTGKPSDELWSSSLADLMQYVRSLCMSPDYQIDPFASDPLFVPLFKVLHGIANQFGVPMLDEAFSHHLLLRLAEPGYLRAD